MQLVQTTWSGVPHGGLVVGPSGRFWVCWRITTAPNNLPGVRLVDPEGHEQAVEFAVDPHAPTTMVELTSPQNRAVDAVMRVFPHAQVIG